MVAMSIECVAVPAFWLWETNKNFPELTSSRNSILKDCGENNLLSVISLDNIGETRNNNGRPLSPRRPNFTQNFRSHAMNLINTTIIETSETSQKSTPDSTTSHFFDFRLRSVVAPMPTVHIWKKTICPFYGSHVIPSQNCLTNIYFKRSSKMWAILFVNRVHATFVITKLWILTQDHPTWLF